jgi:hypothetical protein
MKRESLDGLRANFEAWRRKKRYRQEPIPKALLATARRAARRHGSAAVARATKVDRGRLNVEGSGRRRMSRPVAVHTPTFSRVALAAPAVVGRPFAELEMATGVKVRLFTQTDEVLEWLASLCGPGGAR